VKKFDFLQITHTHTHTHTHTQISQIRCQENQNVYLMQFSIVERFDF